MVSERLNGIALMHVHQEIVPDIEKVIDLFSTKNRRLSFTFEQRTKFSKSGGLTGPQILEVSCWERE